MEFVIWYNLRIVENAYSIVYSTIIQCMSCSNISSLIRIHLVLFLFLSLSPVSSILVFRFGCHVNINIWSLLHSTASNRKWNSIHFYLMALKPWWELKTCTHSFTHVHITCNEHIRHWTLWETKANKSSRKKTKLCPPLAGCSACLCAMTESKRAR